jgi:hypothetical protein
MTKNFILFTLTVSQTKIIETSCLVILHSGVSDKNSSLRIFFKSIYRINGSSNGKTHTYQTTNIKVNYSLGKKQILIT